MGGSHGGYLTALLSALHADRFKGAILRNPVIDLPSKHVIYDECILKHSFRHDGHF